MILDPVPAYVIKTLDAATGEKVFINVCTDPQINPPGTLDPSEIALLVTREQDWIVPIVVSTGRQDHDKAGQKCFVVDCCMHTSVVLLGIEDPSVKVLTVETCIELVEDRFEKALSRDYKFPRLKSKGALERTELDPDMPHPTPNRRLDPPDQMEVDMQIGTDEQMKTQQQRPASSVQVLNSSEDSPFYFHVYRGKYAGESRPSHVVEIDGEHHDVMLANQKIYLNGKELNLGFNPANLDAFYNAEDNTTYIMLWRS